MKKVTWVSSDASKRARRRFDRESDAIKAAYSRRQRVMHVVRWAMQNVVVPLLIAIAVYFITTRVFEAAESRRSPDETGSEHGQTVTDTYQAPTQSEMPE